MSVARCRVRPAVKALGSVAPPCTTDEAKGDVEPWDGARRWDSAIRRRSSRSCFRRLGASSGRVVDEDGEACWSVVEEEEGFEGADWSVILDDMNALSSFLLIFGSVGVWAVEWSTIWI